VSVSTLVPQEMALRVASYLGVFVLMALLEILAPRRALTMPKTTRWASNLGIVVLNALLVRLLVPSAAIAMAWSAAERGWGFLNQPAMPRWLTFALAVVLLDLLVYLQHVLLHAVPALWRLHMVHHADPDFDVTTGSRFHPAEILLSSMVKVAFVAAIGPPVGAVLTFEILLNTTAMFNHSNVRIPLGVDRLLRWLVVTPDMHRVHHSIVPVETNSNFGFNLPWWDHLLGTYRDQPAAGHEDMTIGLRQFRGREATRLPWMLALPFKGALGGYSLGRTVKHGVSAR
jgi:sterol desaturase/sphingolipid hydroxylase (fatty acid hydroxylase superfamily)